MRAYEVPVRKNSDIMIGEIAIVPVQPFIEVSFKNHTSRTTTAEGSNPTWNQDLLLNVRLVAFLSYNIKVYINLNLNSMYIKLIDFCLKL